MMVAARKCHPCGEGLGLRQVCFQSTSSSQIRGKGLFRKVYKFIAKALFRVKSLPVVLVIYRFYGH